MTIILIVIGALVGLFVLFIAFGAIACCIASGQAGKLLDNREDD